MRRMMPYLVNRFGAKSVRSAEVEMSTIRLGNGPEDFWAVNRREVKAYHQSHILGKTTLFKRYWAVLSSKERFGFAAREVYDILVKYYQEDPELAQNRAEALAGSPNDATRDAAVRFLEKHFADSLFF